MSKTFPMRAATEPIGTDGNTPTAGGRRTTSDAAEKNRIDIGAIMNILWVEDFNKGSEDRVAMTREWLDTILCTKVKDRLMELKQDTMSDPLSFLETLAKNDSPIVWPDSFASGLAAATLGTAAYRGHKYSDIPPIKAAYEVALLDLAIPYKKDAGQLSDVYSERAQALLVAEEENETFNFQDPDVQKYPSIILAMRLMQKGMPAERIFFLTANDSRMTAPVKSLAGPEFLKKNIIAKSGIKNLLSYVENNAYYQLKLFISSVSEVVLSFVEQAEFMGTKWEESDFKKPRRTNGIVGDDEYFLFEEKKETLKFLNELVKMLPMYVRKEDKNIYYNAIINKILMEFDNVKPLYMKSNKKDKSYEKSCEYSIPARFCMINLKYLRNINVHTSYLKTAAETEVGIIFLMFIGYITEVYLDKNNNAYDYIKITQNINKFFDSEKIMKGKKKSECINDDEFINKIGREYMYMVKKNVDLSDRRKNWFCNITAKIRDDLGLTAWDVLRLTFWSQTSFTKAPSELTSQTSFEDFRHTFHNEAQILKTRPFFSMLCDRLALCENEIKGGVEE